VPDFNEAVPGVPELIAWFGYWPSFHDAEVLELSLLSTGSSTLRLRTWELTNEVNEEGYFRCVKHVIVSFILEKVTAIHLDGFKPQSIISELLFKQTAEGYELTLEGCYGVEGTITAELVRIEFRPELAADVP
jgi:hypothetical protein